jgi:hypothetical protein
LRRLSWSRDSPTQRVPSFRWAWRERLEGTAVVCLSQTLLCLLELCRIRHVSSIVSAAALQRHNSLSQLISVRLVQSLQIQTAVQKHAPVMRQTMKFLFWQICVLISSMMRPVMTPALVQTSAALTCTMICTSVQESASSSLCPVSAQNLS